MEPMKVDPHRAERELAAHFCRQVTGDLSGSVPTRGVTKADLISMGQELWGHGYAKTSNDTLAFEGILNHFQGALSGDSPSPMLTAIASAFTFLPMEQLTMFGASRWVDQGYPVIQVGHKYAAALMATSVGPDSVDEVHPPFACFLIELPQPLLSVWDPDENRRCDVKFVLAHRLVNMRDETVWNFVALTDGRVSLWRHGVPPKDMTEPDPEDLINWTGYSFGVEADDTDERTSMIIGRLILGICIAMSNKDNVKEIGRGHTVNASKNRMSSEPLLRTFRVGQPIKLDLRESIRDYLEGRKSTSPTVQSLVRGHWKRQPYGPQASLRKWIWREPFWRGPEDAPIITRPHQI